MLNFKPVELCDRHLLEPIFHKTPYFSCNYNFIGLILWNKVYPAFYTFADNFLVTATKNFDNSLTYNFPPYDANDMIIKDIIEMLVDYSKQNNIKFKMDRINDQMKNTLSNLFPNRFIFKELRWQYEYIYNVADLIELKGSKYQPKRNHINQFIRNYDYKYSQLTVNDVPECISLLLEWKKQRNCNSSNCIMNQEICTALSALENFKEYKFTGGVIRVDNKIVAYCMGQSINDFVFDTMFEKGLDNYIGIYAMINQQFAKHQLLNYQYVNREEDMDNEGLRKSKMSYFPTILLRNYEVTEL